MPRVARSVRVFSIPIVYLLVSSSLSLLPSLYHSNVTQNPPGYNVPGMHHYTTAINIAAGIFILHNLEHPHG
ncbi:hypothetical protein A0H81_06611 [Grifola frondosa]|uniref:Uncharacterized protein n=1 Tax=Grifola frondosa TaxID=5627 RepID=A0A1C7M819_GRIFR|nr:hypothetical protein A0H81_06611 [Grifola frondosa]